MSRLDRARSRLLGRPLLAGAGMGAAFGILMGLFYAVQSGSVLAGVLAGVVGAPLYGGAMYVLLIRRVAGGLGRLSSADRVRVLRAVNCGDQVDPALAPAVLDYAGRVRRLHSGVFGGRHSGRIVLAGFAVLEGAAAVDAASDGNIAGFVFYAAGAAFFTVMAALSTRLRNRALAKVDAAEASAGRLTGGPSASG